MKTLAFSSKITVWRVWLFVVLLLLTVAFPARATTYYSKGTLAPNLVGSWSTTTDGTGTSPANFTTAGDLFIIQAGHTMNCSAGWTLTGAIQINATGVLQQGSGGVTAGSLNNSGKVDMNVGSNVRTLTLNGNLVNNGVINAPNTGQNTTLKFSGNAIWTGSGDISVGRIQLVVDAGKTLDISGLTTGLKFRNSGTMASSINGTLITGTQVVNGNGDASHTLTFSAASTLITANSGGVNGTFSWTGPLNLDTGANYTFNGSAAQVTGTLLPATIAGSLTISNASGVTLSQATTVNGALGLTAGALTTTSTALLTIGAAGSLSGTGYVNGPLAWVYSTTGYQTFPVGKGGNVRPVTLNYTALDNPSTVTVEQFEGAMGGTLPASTTKFGDRYWTISQSGADEYAFNLTLDGTGFSPVATAVMLQQGSPATSYSITFSAPNYTVTDLASIGNFTLGDYNLAAAHYYSVGSLNPSLTTSWTNIIGANPADFTTVGDVFEILNGHSMTNSATTWSVTGGVIVDAGGTLTGSTGSMTLGSLDNSGTVKLYPNAAANTRNLTLKGNLVNHGTINTAATAAGSIIFADDATWTGNGDVSGSRIQLVVNAGVTLDITGLTNNLKLASTGSSQTSTVNGTLITGTKVVTCSNSGQAFTLAAGATLITANTGGVNGTFSWTGALNLNTGANYTFNGSAAQVTGTSMPAAIGSLTINNANGVTLSQATTVDGTLGLTAGALTTSGTGLLTIGATGSLSGSGYVNGPLAWVYSGTGSQTFPMGKGGNVRPVTLSYTLLDNPSTVTVEQFEGAMGGTQPAGITQFGTRYWTISQSGAGSYVFNLTLDGTGFSPSATAVMLQQGSPATSYSTTFASPNYTAAGLVSVGNFTLGQYNLAVNQLVFTTPPTNGLIGQPLPAMVVQLKDAAGNPLARSGTNVTLTLNGGTLASGTTTQTTDANGRATFNDLVITVPGSGLRFTATATGIPPLTSAAFSVFNSAALQLTFTPPPTNGLVGVTLPAVVVQVEDGAGNPLAQGGKAVTLTLNGGTLASGTTTQTTDASGRATFDDLLIMTPGGGLTFTAAATGLPSATSSIFSVASRAGWDTYTLVLQTTNGYHVPAVIGASGDIDSTYGFSGFDYFEWFGITHHRYWFKPSFQTVNPTGGVQNVTDFNAAVAAIRANPWQQATAGNVAFDWNSFNAQFDGNQRYTFQRFQQIGITPMMVNTVFTSQDPLADWGNKFKYWRFWYAYVYFFASQYNLTMYEFRNEPVAWGSYAQWESHWLVCADAMRKAMADVNANYGRNLKLYICGPTQPGAWWDYSLPDPNVDGHGWGSVSWSKVQTDIYGNVDTNIWNYGMYDYHHYTPEAVKVESQITSLRDHIANATNSPNATIPFVITELNTSTGGNFSSKKLDTEDLYYGISTAGILQATATTDGLGDEGGFFLFKIAATGQGPTLVNKVAYISEKGDHNYGGVTRGGVCFQLYAHHFRGGKPLLDYTVTSGDSSTRLPVAVLDEQRHAYYVYFCNKNGINTTVSLDLSALNVQPGAPVTVARVDTNNTGQITDYLKVDANRKVWFSVPDLTALLVWVPQGNVAGTVVSRTPTNDTYLVVGDNTSHGAESSLKVSLHHTTASERRLGFLQFNLGGLAPADRYLLRVCGRNIGTDQSAREILHVYGAGGGSWSETNLTWSTAPGVGKYYTGTNTMSTTTGLGSMTDVEDNYGGVTKGTGLGLYGKFLGPVSFYSPAWATNYVDVTDYVKSMMASNQTQATFVLARIVRYDVNAFTNSYYNQGVYDTDGRDVEIGTKENANPALQPALDVWTQGGVATNPTTLTAVVSNNAVLLSWPADHLGWILQAQTNSAGLGTNWVDIGGSSSSTNYNIIINPANPTVFFRLRSP